MNLIAVYLASDKRTLSTRRVAHVHISPHYDEEDDQMYYESTFYFLHDGILTLATSTWANEHCGLFIGVLEEGEDPELLREQANKALFAELSSVTPVKMQ